MSAIIALDCRATTVHLANENNVIETKVQLNTSISSYEETSTAIFHSLLYSLHIHARAGKNLGFLDFFIGF